MEALKLLPFVCSGLRLLIACLQFIAAGTLY